MRQKELRIALVCYGGVSLAIYMHGVTKEIWKLARASRAHHAREPRADGAQGVYRDLFAHIEAEHGLRLRVLPDILAGASAGGINAVFLAQAIHSGQSLEPLTDLWLETADVDRLTAPEARPWSRMNKAWAMPLVWWVLRRPGNAVSDSVAPETRHEVRVKVSRLIRSRWFRPPFSGLGFSRLIADALASMAREEPDAPLLPPGHPIDLFVTTTDFRGYLQMLRLNSPPLVPESEHRLPVNFHGIAPAHGGQSLADPLELTFAARATASFPGAFPPLQIGEIDALAREKGAEWSGRRRFLDRVMPGHVAQGNLDTVSLIDGSVLVNAPFAGAMAARKGRPAQREVDRHFVYVDPRPDRFGTLQHERGHPVGFFSAIFGALSTIPREQPIRDNLDALDQQSREGARLQRIVRAMRGEVEAAVDRLFGRTLFLDRPTPRRLHNWRAKAQQAAAEQAGYAFGAYAQAKFAGIAEELADVVCAASGKRAAADREPVLAALRAELSRRRLEVLAEYRGGASEAAIAFFRSHDIGFRIRRLRLLARRLSRDWEEDAEIPAEALDGARDAVYAILALYFARESAEGLGKDFATIAATVLTDPGAVLDTLAAHRKLPELDTIAEEMLADALQAAPPKLRRRMLLGYLGFPFYDVASLPLLGEAGLTEFDPVKVDRISPDDALSIRDGGSRATLRGTEFYNFGAFFSRAYRENDYLWGRLHGAERMIDLIGSTVPGGLEPADYRRFKRAIFLAILDEEEGRLMAEPDLVPGIRREVEERMG
ncbi:MAG: patatin-like protein [Sphingomonadales bacterium]|nr:patatin-like protein [Sphingomonadales bacterium]MBD3773218.1 patatin-like protein [Paracoccaceae bacterium]